MFVVCVYYASLLWVKGEPHPFQSSGGLFAGPAPAPSPKVGARGPPCLSQVGQAGGGGSRRGAYGR